MRFLSVRFRHKADIGLDVQERPDNPMPTFSQNLDQSLRLAAELAEQWRHECATPEHLLLSLTDDPDAARVMQACNVDLQKLRDAILASLSSNSDRTAPLTSQSFE